MVKKTGAIVCPLRILFCQCDNNLVFKVIFSDESWVNPHNMIVEVMSNQDGSLDF